MKLQLRCDVRDPISRYPYDFSGWTGHRANLRNRDAEDAEALLGSDYPFFVDSIEPDAVSATLDRAEAAFGHAEWILAQDRMKALAEQVSPQHLADQLYTLWKRYLG